MAQRITDKDLDQLAKQLNDLTKSPQFPYARDPETDRNVAQVGNFHISHAYGGVCLHRMSNTSGGVSCPLVSYHEPKRALYDRMHAFVDGIEFAQS
jgi:hypothetical protein